MAQQAWRQHLCSTRTQLQSLAQRSGFGIWRCCSCVIGHRHGSSDLIPGPGMPYASGRPKKKKKNGMEDGVLPLPNLLSLELSQGGV